MSTICVREATIGLRQLINIHMPNDGCLLLFNVDEREARQCSGVFGLLSCKKITPRRKYIRGRKRLPTISCDMYVSWKD